MIRIYPSRHVINVYPSLYGTAIESHVIAEACTIEEWLAKTVDGFAGSDGVHPISIDVEGVTISSSAWGEHVIEPCDDVRIYPIPLGLASAAAMIVVGIVAVGIITSLTPNLAAADQSSGAGDRLNLNPAKANTAKAYAVIREVLGQDRIYPDYALQPVSRFISPRDVRTVMFLSVGVGRFSIAPSSIKIGSTPISAFGDEVAYAIYQPGDYVASDYRSENWYSAPEVGGSKSATAGLDLDSPSETTTPSADALALSGNSISLVGDTATMPESWSVGTIINLAAPNNFTVSNSGSSSVVAGPLDELAPFVGMKVTLSTRTEDVDLVIASYSPYVPPVAGAGGSPSSISASAAPTTYNFTSSPIVWSLTYKSQTRSLSLTANYMNMSGVVSEITSQLAGIGLVAQDDSGRLKIIEPSSPYSGGVITQSSSPVAIFGAGPVFVTGTASSGGTPEQLANITLTYEDGTQFSGLTAGVQRLALGYRQNRYRITLVDGITIEVTRLNAEGDADSGWLGFTGRTLLDFQLSSVSVVEDNWIGPFMGCPEGETVDRIEWDVLFPGGLQSTTKKGGEYEMISNVIVQYADVTTGAWIEVNKVYRGNTRDGIGYTEFANLPTAIRPMIRMRRAEVGGYQVVADGVQWLALRGRLLERPLRYDDVTTIALTIRTGSRLSAQSDRQINLVATRLYDEGEGRSISAAVRYVHQSLGEGDDGIDLDQLQDLQDDFWTPRGETFDHSFDEQITALEAMQTILGAGMSHLVIDDSQVSAFREGVQPILGAVTPHDQSAELVTTFTAPSADDYTGVDVKYKDPVTFSEETVSCRVAGIDAIKIEEFTLDGVHDRDRAWRIGMRRLMKYLYQRMTHTTGTEMDALAYRFGDRVAMTDDIPGSQTISCIVESIEIGSGLATITVSEQLDWSFPNPRCLIRWQDGSVSTLLTPSMVSDYSLTVPASAADQVVDWSIEPPRMIFCSSTSVGYSAMIDSIEPDADGICSVVAKQYSDRFYEHDDNFAPA